MKNVMRPQEYFSKLGVPQRPRSKFDRTSDLRTTFDPDNLIPVFLDEVLPGDTWEVRQMIFARLATAIKPFMDNLYCDIHWFYVPNRLLWSHWENFMGEQDDPETPVTYVMPKVHVDNRAVATMDLGDYFGLPLGVQNFKVQAMPFRAYRKIFDDWYRDENFMPKQLKPADIGDADVLYDTMHSLLPRFKRKDYFTSALPWAQKGDSVSINLGGTAPVTGTISVNSTPINTFNYTSGTAKTGPMIFSPGTASGGGTYNSSGVSVVGSAAPTNLSMVHPAHTATHSLSANLSSSSAITINAFREAVTLQQFLELDARGGTRYVEQLFSHFGVVSPDQRLQRAEYLAGTTLNINVTPIAQTSSTEVASTPQANLSGMGTMSDNSRMFTKSFVEHGFIMALASVRADLTYQQGLNRFWSRDTKYDFYWPVFANLGEQAILNKEIYAQGDDVVSGTDIVDDMVWGYQERWAEYRYKPSLITGKFRSVDPQSLDYWHLSQEFGQLPPLGRGFLMEQVPIDRVVAVPSEPTILFDARFKAHVTRCMPVRSVPGLNRL